MQRAPLKSAYQLSNTTGIKCLIYGRAGVGKTVLLSTAPGALIFSAEKGLLSLRKRINDIRATTGNARFDIPVWEINSYADLNSAFNWMTGSREARQFQTFGLDSVSEIAEQVIAAELKRNSHGAKAYGEMATEVMGLFRKFRDFNGPNVVFLAKQELVKNGMTGAINYGPMFPGQSLSPQTPYMFDETFHMYVGRDNEGKEFRALRTQPDNEYEAKDRSGMLDAIEYPDLSHIFNKIKGLA